MSLLILGVLGSAAAQPGRAPDWRSVVAPATLPDEPSLAQVREWLRDDAVRVISLEADDGTTPPDTPETAARTSIHLACSPEVADVTGRYFMDCREADPSPAALDPSLAARAWSLSATLVGLPE